MENSRREKILKLVVEQFIKTAEPVGSHTLIDEYSLPYSSATIRNEMQSLEEEGFLEKPHTSSGRIPSAKGYRYYVEYLREHSLDSKVKYQLQSLFDNRSIHLEEVIKQSCEILSQMTNLTSIVLGPDANNEHLNKIQLIPISNNSAVAVFITDTGYVEHRTFTMPEDVNLIDVESCVDILNDRLTGTPISQVVEKVQLIKPILADRIEKHEVIFKTFLEAFLKFSAERVAVFGKENMYDQPEFTADLNRLKKMVSLLEKDDIWRNLSNRDGVVVKIGNENLIGELQNATIVTSSFSLDGEDKGTIALIGPTRMDYDKVLEAMEFVSQNIAKLIKGDEEIGKRKK